ncbi:MAG: prepilin peptidase, partial [Parcubacteria group bacterium]|nr:prepilin peptidase [Parcubacteria group bacterium]
IFILGLIFGSFVNAAVYRVHHKLPIVLGRSMCPHCRHRLGFWDLIPLLSFLFLKGRCRYCRKKISIEYPLVELASGILFILAGASHLPLEFIDWKIILTLARDYSAVLIFLFIFLYDLKYYLILDLVTVPSFLFFLIVNLLLGVGWQDLLFGALIGGGFFALQFSISRGTWLGGGDIRMGAVMGALLGWKLVIAALIIAYWAGAAVGLTLVILKRKTMKEMIPFGTFLSAGALAALLYGEKILQWFYFS